MQKNHIVYIYLPIEQTDRLVIIKKKLLFFIIFK